MQVQENALRAVSETLIEVLGLDTNTELSSSTRLFGGMAEFDSMAVMLVITTLERKFDFVIEDEEITADIFDTVGSLAEFVESKTQR